MLVLLRVRKQKLRRHNALDLKHFPKSLACSGVGTVPSGFKDANFDFTSSEPTEASRALHGHHFRALSSRASPFLLATYAPCSGGSPSLCAAFGEGVGPFSASVYFLSPTCTWETFVIAVRPPGCIIFTHDTALGTGAAMLPASHRVRVKRRRL